ncbi:MAG: MFS transporter [Gemmatimonadetes bacterium]|nr:MFS transporter [Gemmatimonadota bacterium]
MKVGYGELLRGNRNFRSLWFAEIISFLGDWFNTIALYTIVLELSGSGRAVAGMLIAKTLPAFLVTPLAGPFVDRFDRRTILILTDLARAVLAVGLILAHRAESLFGLYACQVAMVAMTGIFFPARSAAIPQICRDDEIAPANALSGGTWSVMLALGAAFGGWVTAALGTDISLGLDSLTFVVSALFLLALPRLPAPAAESGHDRSFLAGLKHLVTTRRTLALAALKPMLALGGGALLVIPVLASTAFPGKSGPLWMGVLYAARGIGALIGSVVLIRIFGESSRTLRRVLLGLFPVAALAYASLAIVPTIQMAAVSYFVAAIASGAVWVMSGTLLQREGDKNFLGRIFAVEFGVMTLMVSATSFIGGELLDRTSLAPGEVGAIFGLGLFIPFFVWGGYLLFERGQLRDSAGRVPPPTGVTPELFEAAPDRDPDSRD